MIYAGILSFGLSSIKEEQLLEAISSYSKNSSSIIRKGALVLCYGKLSDKQDMDDIWDNDSSILIGRVFDKEHSLALEKNVFKQQSLLDKNSVLNKLWGKYVYLNAKKGSFEIVVDSTGQLPFFYCPLNDGSILFSSDIEIIFKILNQKFDYNWDYFFSYLVHSNSCAIQTPFKNIFELPPGCALEITKDDRKTTPFWNPLTSYRTSNLQQEDAVTALQKALKPWIKPYKTICVSLSGGLDSSALTYCLQDLVEKGQTLTALNYFHSQIQSSNELAHAQKVCDEIGINLIEVDVSNSLPFEHAQRIHALKPNKPSPGLLSERWAEIINDHIPSHESFTFISGHGSDHIFMRPPPKSSTADYLIENGFKGYNRQLNSIAQFYRDPLYSILKENVVSLWSYYFSKNKNKRTIENTLDEIPHWVNAEIRQQTSSEFVHPIYELLPNKILPGKYSQVDALYEGFASIHADIMDQSNPIFYPFLYEPVTEFALSFPVYDLFKKGYDRYPLRKAVSDSFKTNTVWRLDKSQTTGVFQLGIKQNLERVLALCLEGHFVTHGLIDKKGLHNTITLIGNGDIRHMWPFMHLASIEMFIRYWDEKPL
ncbi:MAG: hypothetical protein K2Y18_02150 [Alphaproteobacteria bacterium]|jgi:asparagine synthase (glutamine-hydrolysing)|nr:hypothetical protein [Alphaproteobacteria bacterium]